MAKGFWSATTYNSGVGNSFEQYWRSERYGVVEVDEQSKPGLICFVVWLFVFVLLLCVCGARRRRLCRGEDERCGWAKRLARVARQCVIGVRKTAEDASVVGGGDEVPNRFLPLFLHLLEVPRAW